MFIRFIVDVLNKIVVYLVGVSRLKIFYIYKKRKLRELYENVIVRKNN